MTTQPTTIGHYRLVSKLGEGGMGAVYRATDTKLNRDVAVSMKPVQQFTKQAAFLRKSSGSTNIEKTLMKAVKVLTLFNILHSVCGGFAVQEHGYPRASVNSIWPTPNRSISGVAN